MIIEFLHGTETGSAELAAEDMADALKDTHECSVASLLHKDPGAFGSDKLYVFAVSTFGSGDLPSTAQGFYDKLSAQKPDLSSVSFAMFGLGDTAFADTFNFGSKAIFEKLVELGAKPVTERVQFDISSGDFPEDVAVPWVTSLVEELAAA